MDLPVGRIKPILSPAGSILRLCVANSGPVRCLGKLKLLLFFELDRVIVIQKSSLTKNLRPVVP